MAQPEDVIPQIIGSFGLYHWFICFLLFLSKFPIAFHQQAIIFLDPPVTYTCPDTAKETCPCPNPVYNYSVFTKTITTHWNLICEKKTLGGKGLSQMIFQAGTLIGSIAYGMAADRFGRKIPLLVAVIVQLGAGVGAAYVEIFWLFSLLRFLVGTAVGGTMVTTFVIIMEFVGVNRREIVAILYQAVFVMGCMALPLFAYFIRDFQNYQLLLGLTALVQIPYFCFVPESPRWLIAVKQTEKAIKVVTRAAQINKLPTANIRSKMQYYQRTINRQHVKKGQLIDLFRTPNLRKNIIAMSCNWFNASYCYYGLSQYIGDMGGDIFLNVTSSTTVTFVGTLLAIPIMKFIGRKTIVQVCNITCFLCLVALIFVPKSIVSVIFGSLGVVFGFISFITVYLYCIEMFPTVVRNAALGFCSMLARVGSMIAPFVVATGDIKGWLPPLLFGLAPFLAAIATIFLPETKGCTLTTTLEEGEQFGKKPKAPQSSWWPFSGWLPFSAPWPFK